MGMSEPLAYVGVIGSSEASEDELDLAASVGSGLAQAGAALVCGGRGGVMEAACRGAKQHDGLTIGVLPGTDRADANDYVDVALPTGLGELRNGLVVRFSDALIAVGGGWGTLSEVAFAMRTGRPVVALAGWRSTLEEASRRELAPAAGAPGPVPSDGRGAVDGPSVLRLAEDPAGAVREALALAREISR